MLNWTLISEYLALIFIAIIAYFFYGRRSIKTPRRRLYWYCLHFSAGSIVLNILTIWMDKSERDFSLVLSHAVNTAYFLASIATTVLLSTYLLMRVYEFTPSKRGLSVARNALTALGALYTALILTNPWTGLFFYFDGDGNYLRGMLNRTVFALPVAEMLLIVVCCIRNRKSVSLAVKRIINCIPIVVVLLLAFQLMFPEQMLNGTFAAIVDLVIFMNFQSVRVEVDPLTELGNRSSFADELERRIETRQDCQIMLIGLRDFSEVNSIYGHTGGDAVLFQVARRLEGLSRGGFVYRLGGDEFIVLLPYYNSSEQDERLYEVVSAMRRPWSVGGHEVRIRAATIELRYLDNGWKAENVVNRLEFSLAEAKRENLELLRFDQAMSKRYAKRKRIQNSMKTAVEQGRFEAWFQPILSAETGRFDTAEALVRMRDEQGRLLSPADFVPLAEKSEIIDEITWVVVHGACDLLQSGTVPELRQVSVNLTARQLLQTGITKRLLALLAEHGVEPREIKLEITERTVTENGALVASVMQEMRDCGFEFMMDDFGTGYSNLSSTVSMPFAYIKLDKSLIDGICEDGNSDLMVSTLIPFFHKVGEKVVAEGIETAGQAEAAVAFGADRLQGYFFAKPMPADELYAWYESAPRPNIGVVRPSPNPEIA